MELANGTLLGGRYRVGALLGSGGMGSVYEGVQEGLNRKVALKVLHGHLAGDRSLIERFKREAHSIATLGHPNVVQVSDFQFNEGEPPFIVMELLQGESLSTLLKREPRLPEERVAYIAVQVLSALGAAHRGSIVHRDIKPDNIYLCSTSVQADLVKILDFGVAKVLRDEKDPKLTRTGFVVGTLAYMAPEQAKGEALDGRADLYSLGACLYLALAGRKPFDAPSTPALLAHILKDKPVALAALRTDIDEELAAIVERSLEKDPRARFATAEDMAAALAPFAAPTTALAGETRPTQPQPRAVSSVPTVRQVPAPATEREDPAPMTTRDAPPSAVPVSEAPVGQRSPTTPVPPAPKGPVGEATLKSNHPIVHKQTLKSGHSLGAVPAMEIRAEPQRYPRPPSPMRPARKKPTSPLVWIAIALVPIGALSLLALAALVTREPAPGVRAQPRVDASVVTAVQATVAPPSNPLEPVSDPSAAPALSTAPPPRPRATATPTAWRSAPTSTSSAAPVTTDPFESAN